MIDFTGLQGMFIELLIFFVAVLQIPLWNLFTNQRMQSMQWIVNKCRCHIAEVWCIYLICSKFSHRLRDLKKDFLFIFCWVETISPVLWLFFAGRYIVPRSGCCFRWAPAFVVYPCFCWLHFQKKIRHTGSPALLHSTGQTGSLIRLVSETDARPIFDIATYCRSWRSRKQS